MAVIHMICGPVGVGKTTYAIRLAKETGAIRFSIDDWIADLYFDDMVFPLSYDWAVARAKRCEAKFIAVSSDVLALGMDVVWDMGCMEREQRSRILAAVAELPYPLKLYALEAPEPIRRKRVKQRNTEKSEGYIYDVTDEMFDFMEARSVGVGAEEVEDMIRIDTV